MPGMKGRSGGVRPNAGRKRRDPAGAWLRGDAPRPKPRAVSTADGDTPRCPAEASAEVQAEWRKHAPHALAEHTLTARTAYAFYVLCRNLVLERKLAEAPLTCAGTDHRGMMSLVKADQVRFRLVPDGRPHVAEEAEQDEWSEFDKPRLVRG